MIGGRPMASRSEAFFVATPSIPALKNDATVTAQFWPSKNVLEQVDAKRTPGITANKAHVTHSEASHSRVGFETETAEVLDTIEHEDGAINRKLVHVHAS